MMTVRAFTRQARSERRKVRRTWPCDKRENEPDRCADKELAHRHFRIAFSHSLGGYLGLTIGWIEGIELNFMGGVLGLDIRRPALKLPAIGRLGRVGPPK